MVKQLTIELEDTVYDLLEKMASVSGMGTAADIVKTIVMQGVMMAATHVDDMTETVEHLSKDPVIGPVMGRIFRDKPDER